MPTPVLHIGNKNYSSWSMRPWLALKWGGIPFQEHIIPLGGEGYGRSEIKEVRAVSPSGRVPALHIGDAVIHESIAICEWAAEQSPNLWPADPIVRAQARAVAAEMHAGFFALRRDMSCNVRRRLAREPDWPEDTRKDLERLFELWAGLRVRFGGEGQFLFGPRSIADAMFAPVCTRLRTYAVKAPQAAQSYCAAVFADPVFKDWEQAAEAEPWTIEQTEALYR
ncbi:MAG TPA: glutathione S-transferase family protein [Vitreimonas sp.]|uniref:glutathione S-transferase family protein n=1 Tax=Vitreimonas sp. TaxID=3069702 RepID=UPI002D5F5269|nr:glutathione S-transferase family protein [Vitreimonas sp.]HYD88973.1 glutathione S-transferase family protein [Vitreimonas sp.]